MRLFFVWCSVEEGEGYRLFVEEKWEFKLCFDGDFLNEELGGWFVVEVE